MKLRVIDRHLLRTVMRQVGSQYQTAPRLERRFDTQLDSADLAPRNIEQDRQFGQGFPNQGNGGLCQARSPCEPFRRATVMPARCKASKVEGWFEAGPMVATIVVLDISFSVVGLHAANMTETCQCL
ncbi:hypothetical protein [Burkholderia gladioli]|uniref:hypothetical protein n=1 Tax=Burkholderia gladioli TaxID=28095 RepID=UPI0016407888|nr:hypothetical protein [Burkholderia gladioli]